MNLGSLPAGGGLALAPLAQTAGVTCLSHCQWRFEESGTGHGEPENRDLTPGKPGPPSQGRLSESVTAVGHSPGLAAPAPRLTPAADPEPEAQRTSCHPSQPGATGDARSRPGAALPGSCRLASSII